LHTRVGILVGIGWYFTGKYQPIPTENSVGIFRYYKIGGSPIFPKKGGSAPFLNDFPRVFSKKESREIFKKKSANLEK
jgi:hypothetical protein